MTPNLYQQSEEELKDLRENPNLDTSNGSPCQTNYCPWCGHIISPFEYKFDFKTKWTLVRCPNKDSACIFTD